MEIVTYGGWPNCVRLSNGSIELIATTDVGPRVIRFGFVGGPNLLTEFPDHLGRTGDEAWLPYGGHRFWHAPEVQPRTYWPDNGPVPYSYDGGTLTLRQAVEGSTGLAKELAITLDPSADRVALVHRLINRNLWAIEAAPWAVTIMAPGGRAIVPQEPYRPQPEALLPARPLVLWHYTDMADPRWTWGTRYVQLRQDPARPSMQKCGMQNSLGWAAYALDEQVFMKRFALLPDATYPDHGCNTEIFTNGDMLEVESLGPLAKIEPGGSVLHVEHWALARATIGVTDDALDADLLPLIAAGFTSP
ncbi:MAG: hypothetical protein JWM80_4234 [Cyanobacteria bacterium RYN_339]|nr:hypothetical protein [Cyanobacteria bacterium RYN_339]